ncbi:MAG TPA: transglycosylase domain-containing protein [Verrucomicrobiales bacterium]|nr:transglycosylase domain-containing protein [Verrucomicrobiales bacterium]
MRPGSRQPRGPLEHGYGWYRRKPWYWRLILGPAALGSGLAGVGLAGVMLYYGHRARDYDLGDLGRMPERSIVYDVQGRELGSLHGANRIVAPLGEVSDHFVQALLAREDKSFYRHHGVDFYGLARAVVRNLRDWKFTQGASTITMQLARNSYPLHDKTGKSLDRKLTEMMLARRIEDHCTKDRILELYVNRIFFGSGLYGVERASHVYFGKPARELELSESALLAGIIRSPNRFSPIHNLPGAVNERDTVLRRMVLLGFINEVAADEARRDPIEIVRDDGSWSQENYAMDAVRRDLDLVLEEHDIDDGGLRIFTTLDAEIQRGAEAAVERRIREVERTPGYSHQSRAQYEAALQPGEEKAPAYLQAAVVAIDNRSGGMLAIVGGRDYAQSKYNRALHSRRQLGSVFKPFVYAAAYESAQLLPQVLVNDDRIAPGELGEGHGNWSPDNADSSYRGYQSASYGLIRSRNTMSARVGARAGVETVVEQARVLGLSETAPASQVSFLGTFETTVKGVTSAYSTFPSGGIRHRPFLIRRIETRSGAAVYESGPLGYRVMAAGAAALADDSLREVMKSGTGAGARRLGWTAECGGKTGTTNDFRDAWFVGYTDRVTCGVWVGLDQPDRIIDSGYGSRLALPIWVDVLQAATGHGYETGPLPSGPPRRFERVCRLSGGFATRACEDHESGIDVAIPEDLAGARGPCIVHSGAPPDRLGPGSFSAARPRDPREPGPSLLSRLRRLFR